MKPPAVGGIVALAVVLFDQIAKIAVLSRFTRSDVDPRPLAPFLDLTLRLNRGISFSMFAREFAVGPGGSARADLGGDGLLGWWLVRSRSVLPAIGLGLIIGGALGNAIDRLAHGAVIDYLDLHAFGRHFFVFNVADAAINIGVVLLIFDLLLIPRAPKSSKPRAVRLRARPELGEIASPSGSARGHCTLQMSSNSRNLSRDTALKGCHKRCGGQAVGPMGVGLRSAAVALALTSVSLVNSSARAGDDGSAPLWQGIGSLFGPVLLDLVLVGRSRLRSTTANTGSSSCRRMTELPPPGSSAATADPAWPVNQEGRAPEGAEGGG